MIAMKINTHILGLLVVVGLFSLQSCDDESYDIEGSNQNYVYINVNRWTSTEYPQNTFVSRRASERQLRLLRLHPSTNWKWE